MPQIIRKAFTLIELLVVIAIIGILSSLIVVSMSGVTQKANIAKAQVFSNSLRNALMLNIVGEWKIDEISGTSANDSWGGNSNGTLYGFANTTAGYGDANNSGWKSSSNCISGSCLKFDGSDDYVDCGIGAGLDLTDAVTIGLWVNPSTLTSTRTIFFRGIASAASGSYAINQEANKINGYIFDTAWRATSASTTSLVLNQWYYVVLTYDKTNLKLYINGVNEKTSPLTTSINIAVGSTTRIGDANGVQRFNGSVDEIRIFNAALSSAQIQENYYIGLNSLLASGQINEREYGEKINSIAKQ